MSSLLLLLSLLSAVLTANLYWPRFTGPRLSALSFTAGWLTGELALIHLAGQVATTLVLVVAGALSGLPGQIGLVVMLGSWAGLLLDHRRAHLAGTALRATLPEALGADYEERILPRLRRRFVGEVDWRAATKPYRFRLPDVERIRDIRYGRATGLNLKLDVYRHSSRPENCPTLLQIHGGGWVIGSKNEQALPLMNHLASRGWVCVSADYRLSPHATFPDHLVDIKRALAWIREHGREYGADPDFVVVTGGSAGGHLAALMALTANDAAYQPGFESVDTSLAACIPFYGVYDFTDRNGYWHHDGLAKVLEKRVMKGSRVEIPDAYDKASPLSRVTEDAPPFLVIHGDCDTLVPVEGARSFVAALRACSRAPVAYSEIPGAQHAFELFPSVRTAHAIAGVERFVSYCYSRYLEGQGESAAEAPSAEPQAGEAAAGVSAASEVESADAADDDAGIGSPEVAA